jgi:predicted CoA-substrate-specific enzyme activase
MFFAGIDLGSATGKAVIMENDRIVSRAVISSTAKPEKTGLTVFEQALSKANLKSISDIDYIVGTGYGRSKVSFIKENMSEITCHAKGAHWLCPGARTIIDVGGQDCKVIAIDKNGKVIEFSMNDKCAAGTGKFFEAMARTLECSLDEFSELSLRSESPCTITKQCSVFAESEVISLINDGVDSADIAGGLTDSIVRRLLSMIYKVGVTPSLVLTGGCAKNQGLIKGLEARLGTEIVKLDENPQIVGALGAALFAHEKFASQKG